ncbi:hypothetical protein ANO11243_070520 [Dothideomycetidae sp. 11243]|nr:hypothetical protein ANO11243_070520 [fungal sp. No.11243]
MSNKKSFLSLPREIRDAIYIHALVSPSPIRVHHRARDRSDRSWPPKYKSQHIPRSDLAYNLLRACRTTAAEAAPIFYGRNTFSFRGEHSYGLEVDWLGQIGPENRAALRAVQIDARLPSHAWQLRDGTLEGFEDGWIDFLHPHPRHALLQRPREEDGVPGRVDPVRKGGWQEGPVDDIDPALEEMFTAFGPGQRLKVEMHHVGIGHPGVEQLFEDSQDSDDWYSVDMPNLIEAWRVKSEREISVQWCTWDSPDVEDLLEEKLLEVGIWDVVSHGVDEESTAEPKKVKFVLEHKGLRGKRPVAAQPNGYIGWVRPAEDMALEERFGLVMEEIKEETSMVPFCTPEEDGDGKEESEKVE